MEPNQMMNKDYLEADGLKCPFCGSVRIEKGDFNANEKGDFNAKFFTRPVGCNACGAEWDDAFKLVGYMD